MGNYKEFRTVRKSVHIDNERNFQDNLNKWIKDNPNVKIEHIITHKAYHITIIYSQTFEVNNL